MFSGFKESDLDKPVKGSLFHTIEYELSGIVDKITNINKFDEKEIKDIIIRQHKMILNYDNFLVSEESRSRALTLFTDKNFLRCFLDVIRILKISEHEKICINKVAYDYWCLPLKDQEVSDLLFRLTTEVNGKEVVILSAILGLSDAQILSMLRNSSFDEAKVISRVNNFIIKLPYELTMKNLADIYCNLFSRVTTLFVQSMLETKNPSYTIFESKRFDEISIVLLEIINSMPSLEIKKVLESYAYTLNKINGKVTVRFALKSVTRYDRILRVLKEVEIENCEIFKVRIP
jgi:hypothetical protein